MADPLTLAVIGGWAAQEGVKFLYGQVAELLKRMRERKAGEILSPARTATPEAFGTAPPILVLDPNGLSGREQEVEALLKTVGDRASGQALSAAAAADVAQLRALVEALAGQRIDFRDEPVSRRPTIDVDIALGLVEGDATLVDLSGSSKVQDVVARGSVQRVGPQGSFTGVRAKK